MNKMIRYIMIKVMVLFAIFSQSIGVQAAPQAIQVRLNQKEQRGINPIIEKGTTLVPLRSVSDLLGASISWDGSTKTIVIVQNQVTNTLTLNETVAYKEDGNEKTKIQLSLAPTAKNGTTYVPLRYIAESLNVKVSWDQEARQINMNESLNYNNKKIFLGESTQEIMKVLGRPSFTMADEVYEYLFYIDDYKNALILYSTGDIITGFATNAQTMEFRDIRYNSKKDGYISGMTILRDQHDGNKVVGLGCNMNSANPSTKASLLANERIIFELTNAFRAHNNIAPFKYNDKLSNVARKHSKDMADKDYFSHTSLDGTSMSERISQGGINWSRCGENIAAGNQTGFDAFGQWLNSLGHRKNMLEQSGDLGVGSAYNGSSTYGYYQTQNFAYIR